MEKRAFWMALVALMFSIGTIGVMIMGVWEMSVIDSNTFISTIVGLMALVFTLLVGYQIYNAITAREKMDAMKSDMDVKLKEIDALKDALQTSMDGMKKEIDSAHNDVKTLTKEFEEGGYILQARIAAGTPKHHFIAFLKMLAAIKAALDVDHREDGYGWMMTELKEFMLLINNGYSLDGHPNNIILNVQRYKDLFKDNDMAIRSHDNYYVIRDTYEPLMADFEKRLNGIAKMKTMSFTEVGEELKVE